MGESSQDQDDMNDQLGGRQCSFGCKWPLEGNFLICAHYFGWDHCDIARLHAARYGSLADRWQSVVDFLQTNDANPPKGVLSPKIVAASRKGVASGMYALIEAAGASSVRSGSPETGCTNYFRVHDAADFRKHILNVVAGAEEWIKEQAWS